LVYPVKGRTQRLRVSESRVTGKILGSKREEVTGGWRELHYEELHDLYSLLNINDTEEQI
jgi:hypothetical protein